jgi:hypothetical protein
LVSRGALDLDLDRLSEQNRTQQHKTKDHAHPKQAAKTCLLRSRLPAARNDNEDEQRWIEWDALHRATVRQQHKKGVRNMRTPFNVISSALLVPSALVKRNKNTKQEKQRAKD